MDRKGEKNFSKMDITKENLNKKITIEVKNLSEETKNNLAGKNFNEYEVKHALRNTLYTMNMSDDTIQALMEKDNILEDAYKYCLENNKTDNFYDIIFDYLDKSEHDHIAEKLYERVNAEFETRHNEIIKLTPIEIINSAYEIVTLDEIRSVFENNSHLLSTEQLKGMMRCESPLWSVYNQWQDYDVSYLEDMLYIMKETASEKAKEMEGKSFEFDAELYDTELEKDDEQEQ